MAAVLMMSVAFMGCDNSSSSSSESGKKKGFTIEAQIGEDDPVTELTSATKETEYLLVTPEDDKTLMKKVEVEISFNSTKKGVVNITENNPQPGWGINHQLCVPGDDLLKSISDYLEEEGQYTFKIKAQNTAGKYSNTVEFEITYRHVPN